MKELDHVLTIRKLTENLKIASHRPPGFTMQEARRIIMRRAGFKQDSPNNAGIICPVCRRLVKVTVYGYVTTHQKGTEQCPFSNINHFKRTLNKMRRDRWICNANHSKDEVKRKMKARKPAQKKKSKGNNRQDRLIYATGRISVTSGGLPTLGRR